MAKLYKQLFGAQVRIEIVGEDKQEAIDWRNYFYNWGCIQIAAGNELDVTNTLNEQELTEMDEMRDGVHFSFYANKEKVIHAFRSSAEANTDWEQVNERGGQRARRVKHAGKSNGRQLTVSRQSRATIESSPRTIKFCPMLIILIAALLCIIMGAYLIVKP